MHLSAKLLSRVVAFTGLGLFAVFTLVDKGSSHALQWPWYLYAQILWLAPALWLAVRGLGGGGLVRFGGGLDGALAAFAVANGLAALRSPFPADSVALLPCALAPVTLAYALAAWLNDGDDSPRRRRLVHLANAGAAFLGLAALVSLVGWLAADVGPRLADGHDWRRAFSVRNERPLGHSNYTAGLALVAFAWLGGLARERTGAVRAALLLGAGAALAVLFSSGSRGGFLGLGSWALWAGLSHARRHRWPVRRLGAIALGLTLAGGGLFFLQPRLRTIGREWAETGTLNTGDRQRLAMLEFGRQIVAAYPIGGIGPGATPHVYPHYRAQLSGGVESALQLHCTPVQFAVDAGLVGLAAALVAAGILVRSRWRRSPDTDGDDFAAGSLLAYAVLAATDYQLDVPLFAAAAGSAIAVLAGRLCPVPLGQCSARCWGAGAAAAAVAFGLYSVRPWSARAAFAQALEALSEHDVAGYHTAMTRAIERAPLNTHYRNLHGLLLADLKPYRDWFEPVDLGADRSNRALAIWRDSLRVNPDQELVHFNLGWKLLEADPTTAEGHFRSAARLVPDKGGVYFGLGLALLRQDKSGPAIGALALEMVNDPAFVASPAWRLCGVPPALAVAARHRACEELAAIAAQPASGDRLGIGRRAAYGAELLRWLGGDDDALPRCLALGEPDQRPLLAWLGGSPALPAVGTPPWTALARAAVRSGEAQAVLEAHYASLRRGLPTEASLAALAEATRTRDRRTLLLPTDAPAPALLILGRRERSGYGLLMRNLDGPPPRDLYVVTENRIVRDFLQPLFPAKGYLSGPVLTAAQRRLFE